jgi:DNA-binding transcriptional regulator YdaS (Cro superfamily)
MQLTEYLASTNTTVSKFSEMTGLLPDTINKYKMGIRIPKPEPMRLIYKATKGEVTPNDFYDVT